MKSTISIGILLFVAFVAGCKEEPKKKKYEGSGGTDSTPLVSSSGFLKSSDMKKPSKVGTLSEEDLTTELNEWDAFYNNDPDNSDDDCASVIGAKQLKASEKMVQLDHTIDIAKCMGEPKIRSAKIRIFFQLECDSGDFSDLNGKTMHQAEDRLNDDCPGTISRGISQSEFFLEWAYTDDSKETKFKQVIRESMATEAGGICVSELKSGVWQFDECVKTSVTTFTDATVDGKKIDMDNIYKKAVSRGVQAKTKDTYFSKGSFNIIINDWSGTLTNSGADKAPSWKMSKGEEKAEGTFAGSSLWLKSRLKSPLLRYPRLKQ